MVIHLNKSMWPWPNINDVTQGQISDILLYPPFIQTTFVWNIFSENALPKKYFGATFKIGSCIIRDKIQDRILFIILCIVQYRKQTEL